MGIVTEKQKIDAIKSAFGEGPVSNNGKNISVSCPLCGKTKSIKKKKLSVCLETGVYHCWVCESKGSNIGRLCCELDKNHNAVFLFNFINYLANGPRILWSSCIRHYTKVTKLITSFLYCYK